MIKDIIVEETDVPEKSFDEVVKLKKQNLSSFDLERKLTEYNNLIIKINDDYDNLLGNIRFNNYFNENFKLNNDCYLDIYNCTDKQIVSMYHTKNSFCEYCREPIEGNKYSTSKKEKKEWM